MKRMSDKMFQTRAGLRLQVAHPWGSQQRRELLEIILEIVTPPNQ